MRTEFVGQGPHFLLTRSFYRRVTCHCQGDCGYQQLSFITLGAVSFNPHETFLWISISNPCYRWRCWGQWWLVLTAVIRAVHKCSSYSFWVHMRTALPLPLGVRCDTWLALASETSAEEMVVIPHENFKGQYTLHEFLLLQASSVLESGCSVHLGPGLRTEMQNQTPGQSTVDIIMSEK